VLQEQSQVIFKYLRHERFINFIYLLFDKNKRYSFIQIDRVHRYNTSSKPLKTKRMNLRANSQHPCW